MEQQGRGQLTQRIKDKSKELFGYEITLRQLRLIPYLLHVMQNNKKIADEKINDEEYEIILDWQSQGHITYTITDGGKLTMTKDFWNKANEILYLGYVDTNK